MTEMNGREGSADAASFVRSCVVHGNRMVYYDRGAGTPLVLVHGMFGDHMDWAAVLEPLAEHYRVISVDLPGFGESDKPEGGYGPELFVESLEGLRSELGLQDVVLLGNSFGGLVSTLYAEAHAERVRALVLVSSAGMRIYSTEEQALAAGRFSEENLLALEPQYIEPLFSLNFARLTPQRAEYLERQKGKLGRSDLRAYVHALTQCAVLAFAIPVVPLLEKMKAPVLLLWGENDPVFPPELAKSALTVLPGARLALIPRASHMPQMDGPEEFVGAVRGFLDDTSGGNDCKQMA